MWLDYRLIDSWIIYPVTVHDQSERKKEDGDLLHCAKWKSCVILCMTVHIRLLTWKQRLIIIIIINPLIARVVGAPQIILQPVFSIFPCSPLPSGTCRTPGLSIPWCCLPTSSSVCLVFFPLSLCLARMALARPDERETWPYHSSLRLFTIVRRSSCGPIAC